MIRVLFPLNPLVQVMLYSGAYVMVDMMGTRTRLDIVTLVGLNCRLMCCRNSLSSERIGVGFAASVVQVCVSAGGMRPFASRVSCVILDGRVSIVTWNETEHEHVLLDFCVTQRKHMPLSYPDSCRFQQVPGVHSTLAETEITFDRLARVQPSLHKF